MNEKLRSSPRHSENFETRSLPTLTHCFPRNFTFYVAHPMRSIREPAASRVAAATGHGESVRWRI